MMRVIFHNNMNDLCNIHAYLMKEFYINLSMI